MKKETLKEVINDCKEVKVINTSGISTMWLLTTALIVLKSMGYIGISWWWVFSPIWVPVALATIVLFGCIAFLAVACKDLLNNENLTNIPNHTPESIVNEFKSTTTSEVTEDFNETVNQEAEESVDNSNDNTEISNIEVEVTIEKPKKKPRKKKVKKEVANEQSDSTTKNDDNK